MPKTNCQCPLGGNEENNCADCVYNTEYHFENGECIRNKKEEKK